MSNQCCNDTLAMATVPKQEWCQPYNWKNALQNGTVFPCLKMDFYKGEDNIAPLSATKSGQEAALTEISAVGFAINDLTLYLDTHPTDRDALEYFNHYTKIRNGLLKDYANRYYPLTLDTADVCNKEWKWGLAPAPWEGVC